MAELILHIGPHKTGTTHLQNILKVNKDILLNVYEVMYPPDYYYGYSLFGHSSLINMIRNNKAKELHYFFDSLRDCSIVVLSAEDLSKLRYDEFKTLKQYLHFFSTVRVLFYYRRINSLIFSTWQEGVKHGWRISFPEYLLEVFFSEKNVYDLFYKNILEIVINCFGSNSLSIIDYDLCIETGEVIENQFFKQINESIDLKSFKISDEKINKSLQTSDIEIIRILNELEYDRSGFVDLNMRTKYLKWKNKNKNILIPPIETKSLAMLGNNRIFDGIHSTFLASFGNLVVDEHRKVSAKIIDNKIDYVPCNYYKNQDFYNFIKDIYSVVSGY